MERTESPCVTWEYRETMDLQAVRGALDDWYEVTALDATEGSYHPIEIKYGALRWENGAPVSVWFDRPFRIYDKPVLKSGRYREVGKNESFDEGGYDHINRSQVYTEDIIKGLLNGTWEPVPDTMLVRVPIVPTANPTTGTVRYTFQGVPFGMNRVCPSSMAVDVEGFQGYGFAGSSELWGQATLFRDEHGGLRLHVSLAEVEAGKVTAAHADCFYVVEG